MSWLNLNKQLKGRRVNSPRSKFRLIWVVGFLLILLVGVYLPARQAYLASKSLAGQARAMVGALRNGNLEEMEKELIVARQSSDKLTGSLRWFFWLGVIPIVGGYYNDGRHFASALNLELETGALIVKHLKPFKNELGLVGQPLASPELLTVAVKALDKLVPFPGEVETLLIKAAKEVEGIDTNKYPEQFRSVGLKNKVRLAKDVISGMGRGMTDAKPLLENVPSALGYPNPKTYLVLFQNDKELRPTGGFITAYAFLKFDEGKLSVSSSDDIYRLDERLLDACKRRICPLTPPAPLVKYLPEVSGKVRTAWSLRDANLSPDFAESARQFEKLYEYLEDETAIDGILAVDTKVLEELIKLSGPVEVFGITYSLEEDRRCDCPKVIYELENYASIAAKGEVDRKAPLGILMEQMMVKLFGLGTDKMIDIVSTSLVLANEKHLLFFMHEPKLQQVLAQLNWTGEIKQTSGDYLHINDANFAGGKSNLYVEERVIYDVSFDKSGLAIAELIVEYKNSKPFGTWLNTIYRDYIRVYVPEGAKLLDSKGGDEEVREFSDEVLKKTVFETFLTVRPQNSRILRLKYQLPFRTGDKRYQFLIQKQPGAKNHHYTIKVKGKSKEEFELVSDRQINLPF